MVTEIEKFSNVLKLMEKTKEIRPEELETALREKLTIFQSYWPVVSPIIEAVRSIQQFDHELDKNPVNRCSLSTIRVKKHGEELLNYFENIISIICSNTIFENDSYLEQITRTIMKIPKKYRSNSGNTLNETFFNKSDYFCDPHGIEQNAKNFNGYTVNKIYTKKALIENKKYARKVDYNVHSMAETNLNNYINLCSRKNNLDRVKPTLSSYYDYPEIERGHDCNILIKMSHPIVGCKTDRINDIVSKSVKTISNIHCLSDCTTAMYDTLQNAFLNKRFEKRTSVNGESFLFCGIPEKRMSSVHFKNYALRESGFKFGCVISDLSTSSDKTIDESLRVGSKNRLRIHSDHRPDGLSKIFPLDSSFKKSNASRIDLGNISSVSIDEHISNSTPTEVPKECPIDFNKIRRVFNKMLSFVKSNVNTVHEISSNESISSAKNRFEILKDINTFERDAEETVKILRKIARISRQSSDYPTITTLTLQEAVLNNLLEKIQLTNYSMNQILNFQQI